MLIQCLCSLECQIWFRSSAKHCCGTIWLLPSSVHIGRPHTSRWGLRLWRLQMEAVFSGASANCWPSITQCLWVWTLTTVIPYFTICFCVALNHMPMLGWNTVVHRLGPPHIGRPNFARWLLSWDKHFVKGRSLWWLHKCWLAEASVVSGNENRDPAMVTAHAAACCWPFEPQREKSTTSKGYSSLCMFAGLGCLRFIVRFFDWVPAPELSKSKAGNILSRDLWLWLIDKSKSVVRFPVFL